MADEPRRLRSGTVTACAAIVRAAITANDEEIQRTLRERTVRESQSHKNVCGRVALSQTTRRDADDNEGGENSIL